MTTHSKGGDPIYNRIGDPQSGSRWAKWWVHLEHGEECNKDPNKIDCRLPDLKPLIPKDYFTTTGDVIAKLDQMEKDAWALAGDIRALKNLAMKTLGSSKWLESSKENPEKLVDGKIWATPKTPKRETNTNIPAENDSKRIRKGGKSYKV